MKKIVLSLVVLLSFTAAFAQEESSSFTPPQKGDKAFGFEVKTFANLSYNTNIATDMLTEFPSFYYKIYNSSNSAFVVSLGFDGSLENKKVKVGEKIMTIGDTTILYDVRKTTILSPEISLGQEFYKYKKNIQTVFGYSVNFGANKLRTTYNYINEMDTTGATSVTDWTLETAGTVYSRPLEENYGLNPYFGISLYTGIQVFVLPNISVGFTTKLSTYAYIESEATYTYEFVNYTTSRVDTKTVKLTNSNISLNGKLTSYVNIYFHF